MPSSGACASEKSGKGSVAAVSAVAALIAAGAVVATVGVLVAATALVAARAAIGVFVATVVFGVLVLIGVFVPGAAQGVAAGLGGLVVALIVVVVGIGATAVIAA